MRKRDLHILTSNIYTYTGDQRFSVIHPPDSEDFDLKIEYVQPRDIGTYICQVNTEPKINLAVLLHVTGRHRLDLVFRTHHRKIALHSPRLDWGGVACPVLSCDETHYEEDTGCLAEPNTSDKQTDRQRPKYLSWSTVTLFVLYVPCVRTG